MALRALALGLRHVSACMLRKMLCLKQAESAFGEARYCIAIREYSRLRLTFLMAKIQFDRCPCLTCSIKITQVGISEVVYSQGYSMDTEVSVVLMIMSVRY